MQLAPAVVLRPGRGAADHEELTNVWRDSVEATHHFLSLEAIDRLEPLIRDEYLPRLRIQVAERNDCTLGFIGMDGRYVAMLYVADEARSMGVGTLLLEWAKEQAGRLTLDVNEQNPRAVVFYIRRGFVPVSRSDTDAQGQPHPLLHLLWDVTLEQGAPQDKEQGVPQSREPRPKPSAAAATVAARVPKRLPSEAP